MVDDINPALPDNEEETMIPLSLGSLRQCRIYSISRTKTCSSHEVYFTWTPKSMHQNSLFGVLGQVGLTKRSYKYLNAHLLPQECVLRMFVLGCRRLLGDLCWRVDLGTSG